MNRSNILNYRSNIDAMEPVIDRVQSVLPVTACWQDDHVVAFEYNGICDEMTAHHCEQVINGLIGLYKGK